jgi:RimJ/RimL family protein N-acetyltransferase
LTKYTNSGFAKPVDPFVVLENEKVRMEPLTRKHFPALMGVGLHEELWRWTNAICTTESALEEYLEEAIRSREQGAAVPFVTFDKVNNRVVGSSRFGNIDSRNRRVEIGWTWITPSAQRSHVNSAAKLAMLTHAFETLGCIRVELKTDALNTRSRNAMLRLGCREEGTFRNHMITDAGRIRDTVYFSILADEWPPIRERLTSSLR